MPLVESIEQAILVYLKKKKIAIALKNVNAYYINDTNAVFCVWMFYTLVNAMLKKMDWTDLRLLESVLGLSRCLD